jgi:hypothetical protein
MRFMWKLKNRDPEFKNIPYGGEKTEHQSCASSILRTKYNLNIPIALNSYYPPKQL